MRRRGHWMRQNRITVLSVLVWMTFLAIATSLLMHLVRNGDRLSPALAGFVLVGMFCSAGSAAGMVFCGITGRIPWHGIWVGSIAVYGLVLVYGIVYAVVTTFL